MSLSHKFTLIMPDQFGLSNRINVTVQYYSAPSKITFRCTDILVCACGSASSRARAWEKRITRSQMAGERVNESKSSRNHLQQGTQRWKSQLKTSGLNGDQGRYGISLAWFFVRRPRIFRLSLWPLATGIQLSLSRLWKWRTADCWWKWLLAIDRCQ